MNTLMQYIGKYFHSMYYVVISVLLIVATVESVGRGFPINLPVAVLAAVILDFSLQRFWLKTPLRVPLSAIITGLIVGTVSVNAPILGTFIAAILAILSKFIIRLKGKHIFNPVVFGVVSVQLLNPAAHGAAMHGSGMTMEGFGPGGFAVSLWLVPLLLFANWRANKLWVSIPYLIATALLFYFSGLANPASLNAQGIFMFLEVLPWYFAFIIVSEPKTSPWVKKEQIIFGSGVAILSVLPLLLFGFYSHVIALVALLAGNLIYAAYRT
ncbi:hypothetical protein HYW42_00625 [Candidatus Daviesbacteria bacterium]|nr:hypothetical protein [Candidatus Daviesbacteria bacterium]